MKYCVSIYGPFGPNQRGESRTLSFDTEAERADRIASSGQMESVGKKWEEGHEA